jgi:large subunit ribosomal protein L4
MTTVNVSSPSGDLNRTVELPDAMFDAAVNVPLLHQVVVAQLAAARQGTHDTKTRGEVRGGGRKPYRQKGTGRARQGSIRAPQFAGGGTVHGPTPRKYDQRTPKKMKAAALRAALSDRARDSHVHVVSALVEGDLPSTKTAAAALARITGSRHVLVVVERDDVVTWKSLRNVRTVHVIAPDQLNTYDVLVSDDVVFTEGALASFVTGPSNAARAKDDYELPNRSEILGDAVDTLAQETAPKQPTATKTAAKKTAAPATKTAATKTAAPAKKTAAVAEEPSMTESPATEAGSTKPAGEGVSDDEIASEVAEQTSPDLKAEDVFERESAGTSTDAPAAATDADEVAGSDTGEDSQ